MITHAPHDISITPFPARHLALFSAPSSLPGVLASFFGARKRGVGSFGRRITHHTLLWLWLWSMRDEMSFLHTYVARYFGLDAGLAGIFSG